MTHTIIWYRCTNSSESVQIPLRIREGRHSCPDNQRYARLGVFARITQTWAKFLMRTDKNYETVVVSLREYLEKSLEVISHSLLLAVS